MCAENSLYFLNLFTRCIVEYLLQYSPRSDRQNSSMRLELNLGQVLAFAITRGQVVAAANVVAVMPRHIGIPSLSQILWKLECGISQYMYTTSDVVPDWEA